MIKVCIFGAGSIGGYLAACLSKNDIDLSLIARGPHKKAIEENGLTLIKKDKTLKANFSDSITYKNQESKFKLKKYEDKLKSDLISKVSEDITLFLLSTD